MTDTLRIADLNPKKPYRFDLRPEANDLTKIRTELDLLGLRKMRFNGTLEARGKHDWELTARIGATVVQPCSVTLEPVTTRIEEDIVRLYLADWEEPEDSEVEMTVDETSEPLPVSLSILEVATEALALALPMFPRAPDADLGEFVVTEPGSTPLTEEAKKPFAGLIDLKKRMENKD